MPFLIFYEILCQYYEFYLTLAITCNFFFKKYFFHGADSGLECF